MEEKVINAYNKTVDWWSKHNITTRSVVIVTLLLFAGTVIASWLGKDVKHFDKIIEVLSDNLLWLTAIIIAGVNGATAIVEKIMQYKKGITDDRIA